MEAVSRRGNKVVGEKEVVTVEQVLADTYTVELVREVGAGYILEAEEVGELFRAVLGGSNKFKTSRKMAHEMLDRALDHWEDYRAPSTGGC